MIAAPHARVPAAGMISVDIGARRPRRTLKPLGLAMIGVATALAASPALADQYAQAADNAQVDCVVSGRELTRISLIGDAFASVSKITTG